MIAKSLKRLLPMLLSVLLVLTMIPVYSISAATTVTPIEGQVTVTDSLGNGSLSNGTVTIQAKGSLISKKTNTITVENVSGATAKVTFDYSASTYNSFTIGGAAASASGTYSGTLEAGGTVTIVLTSNSGFSNLTATLTLSNFTYSAAADSSKVTVEYDSTLGSVTAAGSAVAPDAVLDVTLAEGVALVATPSASDVTFLGWVNAADNAVVSSTASFTYNPTSNITIKPVFMKNSTTQPYFMVSGRSAKTWSKKLPIIGTGTDFNYYTVNVAQYLFDNFADAANAAASSDTCKNMVLLNNATLTGENTVPAGVTLLIPFDDENTLYTTQSLTLVETKYVSPTAYRTLTMADGASLVINGAVSLSANHIAMQGSNQYCKYGGAPTGPVSFIRMQGNSNITVNNGGVLYAYGFITGSGSVTALSGGSVYELFQASDFRGGTQSTDMKNRVFPISQYYIQNIEVPLTLYSGASEHSFTSVYMQKAAFGTGVQFIGKSGNMFNLTSGYVVKRYDGATDRLMIESYGDITISGVNLDFGTSDINSSDYILPINSNITVHSKSGNIQIGQDVAFLPGSKVILDEGATGTLATDSNVFVYDSEQWGGYAGTGNLTFVPAAYAPGRTYTRTDADLVDAEIVVNGTFDASTGYIYTTEGGANIYSTGNGVIKSKLGTQTVTYQLVQAADVANSTYPPITIVPAMLLNADGTFVNSAADTYTYTNGRWICTNHTPGAAATCTTAQICTACGEELAAALGHSYDVVTNDATCTENGSVVKTCSVCGDVQTTVIEATGHTYTTETKNPTCTEDGYVKQTCACGDVQTTVLEATGHEYETVVTDPTCTEGGYTTYTCHCGDTYKADETEALGHKYDVVTNDATCTENGSVVKTCSVCGDVQTTVLEATGHDHEAVVTNPTCTEGGYTTYTCHCGDTYKADETEALGHSYETVTNDATCTENGSVVSTCSVCGDVQTTVIEATGHDHEAVVTDPTCTEGGYTTYTCHCGDTYKADETEALGHSYTSEVTKAPTFKEDGVRTYTCSACGHSYEETIPAECNNYIIGDVDQNGEVDVYDLAELRIILLNKTELSEAELYVADADGNGIVNIMDLIRLKKYFAGEDVVLGKAS